ncbi:MAG: hypothetical protein H0V09_10090 [Gemmatimonadetes bacterium]|nr:hypothetical protein [Gemmatimonadota bacterium]
MIDAAGRIVCEAPVFDEALLAGELSRAAVRRARLRNPAPTGVAPVAPDPLLFPPGGHTSRLPVRT